MTTPKGSPVPPRMYEGVAKRLGIQPITFEKFLRWVHGKMWAVSRPSDLKEAAKRYGLKTDMPMQETLMCLYNIYKQETTNAEKAADTG